MLQFRLLNKQSGVLMRNQAFLILSYYADTIRHITSPLGPLSHLLYPGAFKLKLGCKMPLLRCALGWIQGTQGDILYMWIYIHLAHFHFSYPLRTESISDCLCCIVIHGILGRNFSAQLRDT